MMIFRIAIIGAGPAGYFTAQAFQKAQTEEISFSIDMIERLPTPWGLVRRRWRLNPSRPLLA